MLNQSIPAVTVYVLIYNDEIFGRRAINSVLNQSYKNISVVILDNGSTDGSVEMINSFSSDYRVTIIRNPVNQRSEFSTRIALNCKTDFLSFLFSDDYYEPERVERMINQIQSHNTDCVFSNNLYVDEYQRPLSNLPETQYSGSVTDLSQFGHLRHCLTTGNSLHPCSMLIKTKVYKELGGFKSYLHRVGDMSFFAMLLANKSVSFVNDYLQQITVWNSGRNESSSNNVNYLAVIFERSLFLNTFNSDAVFRNFDSIFPELKPYLRNPNSDAEKLFLIGFAMTRLHAPDFVSHGANFMFKAYEMNSFDVELSSEANFGKTFSQLCFHAACFKGSSIDTMFYLFKKRVKNYSVIKKLWKLYKKYRNRSEADTSPLWRLYQNPN